MPDAKITPDTMTEAELTDHLRTLREAESFREGKSGGPQLMGKDNGLSTYSLLVKPALNSASTPFSFGDAEEWDPDVTLGWSNRGQGDGFIF